MGISKVKYLVVHTAASRQKGVDIDVIDRWHRAKGWKKVGYHFVILDDTHAHLPDGQIQSGRGLSEIGAHTLGINSISLGICCTGHGDDRDFTSNQKIALADLLSQLSIRYDVPVHRIIGHRDVNNLVDQGLVSDQYRTDKTCPGQKVSMPEIRGMVEVRLRQHTAASKNAPKIVNPDIVPETHRRLRAGIKLVERYVDDAPNAKDSWIQFRNHPEVRHILDEQ